MTGSTLIFGLFFIAMTFSSGARRAQAAEAAPPRFDNTRALLSLGQDGQIYLTSTAGDSILHCNRDGSKVIAGKTGPALVGATANQSGLMAGAHAHFSRNVTLYDSDYNPVGRFSRLGDYNFTAPAGVESGPSGDFYALDQGRDQVIRFHADGVRAAIYQIPHQEFEDKRFGFLTRFRVCEQTKSLYVVNWQSLRCFSTEGTEFRFTPRLKWELKQPQTVMNLSYSYGGMAVDEKGILYLIPPFNEEFLTSYDSNGNELKKIPLQVGEHKFVDPTRVLGLAVSNGEVFVKRQHESEMFLRFKLDTGELLNAPTLPADLASTFRAPTGANAGRPILPIKSSLGIPAGRRVLRVLFVGNSQVNCVRDIPDMIEQISRSNSDKKAPIIVSDEVIVGGTGLEGYWNEGLGRKRIAGGGWDYVVLNDIAYSFGLTSHDKFMEFAGKFATEAKKVGAKTLIFATGDIDKKREQHQIMYQDGLDFARANHGRVAGAGMAWLKAWEKDPTLDFHYTDRAHPNALGCYFNALTLYSALSDSNPTHPGVSTCEAATPEQAALLQKIAWDQYQEDRKNEKNALIAGTT
jgi:hypothetical protein